MVEHNTDSNIVIACDMTAIDPAYREQHAVDSQRLFAAIQDVQELPTGYGFRLPPELLLEVAEFIEFERLCCPFFTFAVEVEANHCALWLRLTGSELIKQFIRAEFGGYLNEALVQKLQGA
jgi:hypothetical protein